MGYPILNNAASRSHDSLQLIADNAKIETKPNDSSFPNGAKIASVHLADCTAESLSSDLAGYEVRDYDNSKSSLWSKVCDFVKDHKLALGIGAGLVVLGGLASYKAFAGQPSNLPTDLHQQGSAEKLYVEKPRLAVGITVPEPDLYNPVFPMPPEVKAATTKQAATTQETATVAATTQKPNLDCLKIIDTDLAHKNIKITNECGEDMSVKLFLNRNSRSSLSDRRFAVGSGESQEYQTLSVDKHQGVEYQKPGNYSTFDTKPWKKDPDFFRPKTIEIQVASHLSSPFNVKIEDCKTVGDYQCVPILSKLNGKPSKQHRISPGQSPVVSTLWFPSGDDRQVRASYSLGKTMYSTSDDRSGNDLTLADQITNQTSFATLDKNHDGILKATHRLVLADQKLYASNLVYTLPKGRMPDVDGDFQFKYVDATSSKVFCEALTEGDSGGFPESGIVRHSTPVSVSFGQKSDEADPAMTYHAKLGGKEYDICKRTNPNDKCTMPAGTTQLKVKVSDGDFTTFSGADLQKNANAGRGNICFKATDGKVTLHPGTSC